MEDSNNKITSGQVSSIRSKLKFVYVRQLVQIIVNNNQYY